MRPFTYDFQPSKSIEQVHQYTMDLIGERLETTVRTTTGLSEKINGARHFTVVLETMHVFRCEIQMNFEIDSWRATVRPIHLPYDQQELEENAAREAVERIRADMIESLRSFPALVRSPIQHGDFVSRKMMVYQLNSSEKTEIEEIGKVVGYNLFINHFVVYFGPDKLTSLVHPNELTLYEGNEVSDEVAGFAFGERYDMMFEIYTPHYAEVHA